jgi:hypothetical protein
MPAAAVFFDRRALNIEASACIQEPAGGAQRRANT